MNNLPLGMTEEELDAKLQATSPVAKLIKTQIEDEPSLAWRSALNQKLLVESNTQSKAKVSFFRSWKFGLVSGLSVACLALMLITPRIQSNSLTTKSSQGNESLLLAAHNQADFALSVGSTDGAEAVNKATNEGSTIEWTESDLTTL